MPETKLHAAAPHNNECKASGCAKSLSSSGGPAEADRWEPAANEAGPDAITAAENAGLLAILSRMLERQARLWRVTAFVQAVLAFVYMIAGTKMRCLRCTRRAGFVLILAGIAILAVAVYNIFRDGGEFIHPDEAPLPPGTVRRLGGPRKWMLRLCLNFLSCGPVGLLPFLHMRRLRRFVLCNERQLSALETPPAGLGGAPFEGGGIPK